MCYFATMAIPGSLGDARVENILSSNGYGLTKIDASNQSFIRDTEHYFWPSSGGCNCGTSLGAGENVGFDEASFREREEKRLKRKGWGKAKITRAIQQRLSRRDSGEAGRELSNWAQLIEDFAADRSVPYVGLLLHSYAGALTDSIDVSRQSVSPKELTSFLQFMDEDILYEINLSVN